MYSWTSLFLQAGDAALFNLSLLTADIYALIFAYVVEHNMPNWMYFAAAVFIFMGLFVYHSQPPVTTAEPVVAQEISETNRLTGASVQGGVRGTAMASDRNVGANSGMTQFRELRDVDDTASTPVCAIGNDVSTIVGRPVSGGGLDII